MRQRERWCFCLDEYYQISSHGRLRRVRMDRYGRPKALPKFVRPSLVGNGYRSFLPSLEGVRRRRYYIHDLVAAAFLGPKPLGFEVNHKDANKENNCVWNLEYVTKRQNLDHAIEHGLLTGRPRRIA